MFFVFKQKTAYEMRISDWSSDVCSSDLGWNGSAIVRRGDGTRIVLSASGASWFHVYRPPLSRDFCLEPVSHMPDAVNRPEGMESMEPGAEKTLSLRIAFTPADEALPQRDKIA